MDEQYQNVIFAPEAFHGLLKGATILADAVASTLGPSGHSVIIDNIKGPPTLTKDGVSVAKSINLKNRLSRMGAELMKEIAEKTNDLVGDGTSTSVVLAHAMLAEGIKMVATGRSSIHLKQGMDLATEDVITFLKNNCIPVSSKEDIINVGTISANGDRSIGELLADAIEKVGQDGIITIEPAKSTQTTLEIVEGIQLPGGYISPFFITNSEKGTCELENPYVLITPGKISSMSDIIGVLEGVAKNNKSLLIVADDVEGEALHTLIVNKTKGILKVCAIKAPSYGEFRADVLSDLATVAGGTIFGATSDKSLKNAIIDHLGTCKKVIVGRGTTTIIANLNEERKRLLDERVASLRTLLSDDKTLDALHVDKYRKRLACLSGGIAVIRVGGATETEINEKKDRVEDAVHATMAAAQEGVVPGGGVALFYAAQHLREILENTNLKAEGLNDDVISGIEMIAKICEYPFNAIVRNTGVSPEVVAEKLKEKYNSSIIIDVEPKTASDNAVLKWFSKTRQANAFRYGYDAAAKSYTDLLDVGILDPVKVTRLCILNAASIVGLTLTCNAVIVNEEEE